MLRTFRDLKIWQESKGLAVLIFKITSSDTFKYDFSLKEQIRKSAVPIASNIAEGYEKNSKKDFIRYLLIAKGSLSELQTQIEIAKEINYLDNETYETVEDLCQKISGMITNFIRYKKNEK